MAKWKLHKDLTSVVRCRKALLAGASWSTGKGRTGGWIDIDSPLRKTHRGAINWMLREAKKLGLPLEAEDFEEED